jgi:nitrite reductase/ring-hydroxylating ferredoxin subunit
MQNELTRRECLNWLARATAGIAAAEFCELRAQCAEKDGKEKGDKKDGLVKLADLISLRNDSATEFAKQNVILTRTSGGVAALGVFCTHRHNRLEVENGSIVCPVHDSLFDLTGKPISGPASRPLAAYLTQIDDDGAIRVDTSKTVKSGTLAELPAWAKPKK